MGYNQCHPGTGTVLIHPMTESKRPAEITIPSNMFEWLPDVITQVQDPRV